MRPVDLEFDPTRNHGVLLASCGYERRSSYLCRLDIQADAKFATKYRATGNERELENLDLYSERRWNLLPTIEAIDAAFSAASDSATGQLTVDISSMPRKVLAMIVQRFQAVQNDSIDLHFTYCPGKFEHSLRAAEKDVPLTAAPVSEYFTGALRPTSLPIGLIIGLGLEHHRAVGIVELLEPACSWVFASDGADHRYGPATTEVHKELLASFNPDAFLNYNLHSLEATYYELESLVFAARSDFRMILAPSGPKLFALACLLVAAPRHSDRPAVWRVGSAESALPADVEELGGVVFARLSNAR